MFCKLHWLHKPCNKPDHYFQCVWQRRGNLARLNWFLDSPACWKYPPTTEKCYLFSSDLSSIELGVTNGPYKRYENRTTDRLFFFACYSHIKNGEFTKVTKILVRQNKKLEVMSCVVTYLYCVFGWQLYCLNENHTIWYHTRNYFVLVPSDYIGWTVVIGSQKLCTNDPIIIWSRRKRYFFRPIFGSCVGAIRLAIDR